MYLRLEQYVSLVEMEVQVLMSNMVRLAGCKPV